jgi:hypothetical protein
MTATAAPKFRYIGVTDDVTECQHCGKAGLKLTVALALLDLDGNEEDVTYYGSTCAARALSIKGGSRAVLDAARAAHAQLAQNAKHARQRLAHYRADELPLSQVAIAFRRNNSSPYTQKSMEEWVQQAADMIEHWRATVAEAARLGL